MWKKNFRAEVNIFIVLLFGAFRKLITIIDGGYNNVLLYFCFSIISINEAKFYYNKLKHKHLV